MSKIRIGSFNVHNLSQANQEKVDKIAQIIRDNDLDIVALQEVLGEGKAVTGIPLKGPIGQDKAMERSLLWRLGKSWAAAWGAPKRNDNEYPYVGEDKRGEGYVFLWNTKRVDLPKDANGNSIEPQIFRNYKTDRATDMLRLIRDPFCGRFKLRHKNEEIRLITTHIVFGKPSEGNLSVKINAGELTMRRNEFRILAGQIYPRISEYYKTEKPIVPFTLILGDYNMNLEASGRLYDTVSDVVFFDKRGEQVSGEDYCTITTVQSDLSTINGDKTGLASNYDHFSYDDRVARVAKDSARAIPAVDDLYGFAEDKYEKYFDEVSDHLPIILELKI